MEMEDDVKRHVAVYCGQGRRLNLDDSSMFGALQTIISNLIPERALKNDPFIRNGREKVKRVFEFMVKEGANVQMKSLGVD